MPEALYLDAAATTPLDPRVLAAMQQAWSAGGANPASQHMPGRHARRLLEQAREEIIELVGGTVSGMRADRLIFTSGGTEANQLVLHAATKLPGERILISAIEHVSLRGAAQHLAQRGAAIELLKVDSHGCVRLDHLEAALQREPKPALVSIMLANNETGVLQPLAAIAQLCRQYGVRFHSDLAQAVGKVPCSTHAWGVAAATLVPHKFHGPLGIGALLTQANFPLEPLFTGGFQQGGVRPGTENVPLAVGFATALRIAVAEQVEATQHLQQVRSAFEQTLASRCPPVVVVGEGAERAAHISNIAFAGLDRQALFVALDLAGIACSTGSACASGSSEPSPVLLAMGAAPEIVKGALRFSFLRTMSIAQATQAAERISEIANKLRRS